MSQAVLKRWKKVGVDKLALAIFKVIGGKCALLSTKRHGPESSVWGKVADQLGEEFNERVDRFWISTIWGKNDVGIKEAHRTLCEAANITYFMGKSSPQSEGQKSYCICKGLEFIHGKKMKEDMVECVSCKDWFHGICVGIAVKKYVGSKTFSCKSCLHCNIQAFVPPIFLKAGADGRKVGRSRKKETNKKMNPSPPAPTIQSADSRKGTAGNDEVPIKDGTPGGKLPFKQVGDGVQMEACVSIPLKEGTKKKVSFLLHPSHLTPTTQSADTRKGSENDRDQAKDATLGGGLAFIQVGGGVQQEACGTVSANEGTKNEVSIRLHPSQLTPTTQSADTRKGSSENDKDQVKDTTPGGGLPFNQVGGGVQQESCVSVPVLGGRKKEVNIHVDQSLLTPTNQSSDTRKGITDVRVDRSTNRSNNDIEQVSDTASTPDKNPPVEVQKGPDYDHEIDFACSSKSIIVDYSDSDDDLKFLSDTYETQEEVPSLSDGVSPSSFFYDTDDGRFESEDDDAFMTGLNANESKNTSGSPITQLLDDVEQPRRPSSSSDDDDFVENSNQRANTQHPLGDKPPGDPKHGQVEFLIPSAIFDKIKPTKTTNTSKQYIYQMKKSYWAPEVTKHFLRAAPQYKGCVLSFKSGHKITGNEQKGFHVTTKAWCEKAKDKLCSMSYEMTLDRYKLGADAKWIVRAAGTCQHNNNILGKRKLTGFDRDDARKLLETTKPTILYGRKRTRPEVDEEAIEAGNHTEIQNVEAFQNLNKKRLKELDMEDNFALDLMKRKEALQNVHHLRGAPGNPVTGYIQEISLFPLVVTMYCHKQMQLLMDLIQSNPDVVLQLDGSGGLTKELPRPYDAKALFYYAMSVTSYTSKGAKVTPLLEFFTNWQSTRNLGMALHHFFERYKEFSGSRSLCYGIKRLETDNQRALIAATMNALNAGPIDHYLHTAWKCLASRTRLPTYVHHICRRHASNFLRDNRKEHYVSNSLAKNLFKTWSIDLLNGRDLDEFCWNVRLGILICGRKYFTPDVEDAVGKVGVGLPQDTTSEGHVWDDVDFTRIAANAPFYLRSPFGFFAANECTDLGVKWKEAKGPTKGQEQKYYEQAEQADKDLSGGKLNPYYSRKFLDYLIRHIFPLGCLLDHSLLLLNNCLLSVDTNAASESWNKVLKEDELPGIIPMKLGRLVMKLEEIANRRVVLFQDYIKPFLRKDKRALSQPISDDIAEPIEPMDDFDTWKRRGKKLPPTAATTPLHGVLRIKWGGRARLLGKEFILTNTCSIDNQMQILWTLYCCHLDAKQFITAKAKEGIIVAVKLIEMMDALRERDVMIARGIVLQHILKSAAPISGQDWDLFDSEDKFILAICELFRVSQYRNCQNDLCSHPVEEKVSPASGTVLRHPEMLPVVFTRERVEDPCTVCNFGKCLIHIDWIDQQALPFFPYVLSHSDEEQCSEDKMIHLQSLLGYKYKVFAYTLFASGHYKTVFCHRSTKYIYDGLRNTILHTYPSKPLRDHRVSTVWLMLK